MSLTWQLIASFSGFSLVFSRDLLIVFTFYGLFIINNNALPLISMRKKKSTIFFSYCLQCQIVHAVEVLQISYERF